MVEKHADGSDVDNSSLYKVFGRENETGKLLYGLYAAKNKPKISYPPVKTKTRGSTPPKEKKACPQMTKIEYPEMPREGPHYNPIDFVPHRRPGEAILAEIDYEKSRPLGKAPGRMGVDRAKQIEQLQERFQFKDKAELDQYMANKRRAEALAKLGPSQMSDKERRRRRFEGCIAKKALEHYEAKYGKNPALAVTLAGAGFSKSKVQTA